MSDLKRAFGSPDAQFHERVRQTLFRIEEKEEAPVKKKMTLSMALALILCLCIATVSAFAGSGMLNTEKVDATQFPLSQGTNATPTPQPTSDPSIFYHSEDGSLYSAYYHIFSGCSGITNAVAVTSNDLILLGKSPCPVCLPENVYFSVGDAYYHAVSSCRLCGDYPAFCPIAQALEAGAYPCPTCFPDVPSPQMTETPRPTVTPMPTTTSSGMNRQPVHPTPTPTPMSSLMPMSSPTPVPAALPDLFAAEDDPYYHSTSDCARLAGQTLLSSEQASLRAAAGEIVPCPDCFLTNELSPTQPPEEFPFYSSEADPAYYHADLSCLDGLNESLLSDEQTLLRIASRELAPCPLCSGDLCLISEYSDLFHLDATCFSDANHYTASLEYALYLGKIACPHCAHSASRTVLFSDEDTCYHTIATCESLIGQTRLLSEAAAIAAGRSACVDCLYCYVSASDRSVFHMDPRCSSAPDLGGVFAVDALSGGSHPCPECVYWVCFEDNLYHSGTDCLTSYPIPYMPCTLDYASLTGCVPCDECLPDLTVYRPDVLSGERVVYCAAAESSLYHLYVECAGTESVFSVPLREALGEGRIACENCLTVYTHSHPGQTSALYENPLIAPQQSPSDQTRTITFDATVLPDNLHSVLPMDQPKWVSGSLTVHSLVALTTRAGIYMEAEFTLTDPAIDPESIRMTYYCEGYGSFGWNSASVSPITYENGESGYLLQMLLPKLTLPESAADSGQSGIMSLRAYGKTMDGQSDVMFTFQ